MSSIFAFFTKRDYGKNMIVKKSDGYHVISEKLHPNKSGKMVHKNLGGPYATQEEALKRLRQVEFFKHKG